MSSSISFRTVARLRHVGQIPDGVFLQFSFLVDIQYYTVYPKFPNEISYTSKDVLFR